MEQKTNNQKLIPTTFVEAILEDVITSDFEKEVAMTRLRRISVELSQFRNQGGVRDF